MTETDNIDIDTYEDEHTATIGFLVEYLKNNFKPENKVCYMNCVEGLKNDCTYVVKEQLGNVFFRKVKNIKRDIGSTDEFPFVKDEDVIIM